MTEIKMPQFGLTMDFGTITEWLKAEGDSIKKGDAVATIETDKLTNDVEATGDGILLKIIAPVGTEVPVQGLMGYIGAPGESIPDIAPAATAAAPAEGVIPTAAGGEKIKASPVAKKLAQDLGVDLSKVTGTGPMGRITKEDVEKAVAAAKETPVEVPAAVPTSGAEYEIVPYVGKRKRIGENMSKSWTTAPRVTHMVNADVTDLITVRAMVNEGKDKTDKVSVTDLLIFLVARSLKAVPIVNSSLTDEGIRKYKSVNMGVAVAIPDGLVVPVIRNADKKSVLEISREFKVLVDKSRNGGLSPDDLKGATFTISNLGAYNSVDFFTPVINQPESAILGVGRSVETPVVRDGQIVIRSMMGLSISYDHRIIDGAVAAEFIADFLKRLDKPLQAILEG